MLELARAEDRSAVNILAKQVHELHVRWRPDIYEHAEELWPQGRFDEAVSNRQLFVARSHDAVLGYVLVKIRDCQYTGLVNRRILMIDEICVDKSCRNRGIGTQMMVDIRAIARAFGCADLQLGVNSQNNEALAFYLKCGFRIRNIEMHMKL